MTGLDPATKEMAGPTVREQARQALANCKAVLEAAGTGLADVVQVTVLLPARAVTQLGVALPNVLVSIQMTAYVG
jgi:2-iminobutanoate/2-iminopropanoate deaminase